MLYQILFFLGAILVIPFLPILLWQGKRLRAKIPDLPEADGPNQGTEGQGKEEMNILVIGESTMAGVGIETQQDGITRHIAIGLSQATNKKVDWQVIAKSGYNAKKVLAELVPQVPETPIDILFVGLSVNDAVERNSPLGWRRDLQKLILALRQKQPDCPIVLLHRGPVEFFPAFPWIFKLILGSTIKLQWAVIQSLQQELDNFHIINWTIKLENWNKKVDFPTKVEDFFSDGVHPSKLTYQLWAREVVEFVQEQNFI